MERWTLVGYLLAAAIGVLVFLRIVSNGIVLCSRAIELRVEAEREEAKRQVREVIHEALLDSEVHEAEPVGVAPGPDAAGPPSTPGGNAEAA